MQLVLYNVRKVKQTTPYCSSQWLLYLLTSLEVYINKGVCIVCP